jgi:V/A-type H+-transporting ATPase subunit C
MKETEFVNAVATVRAYETKLLNSADVENLISAQSFDDAVKMLNDRGFADFENRDENEVLSEKQIEAYNFLQNISPDKHILDFLIVKNDFHNIKAFLKALVSENDPKKYYIFPSVTDVDLIEEAISEKKFDILPLYMKEFVEEGYDLITRTLDGQLLDVYLDKASLEATLKFAEDTDCDFAKKLAETLVATANIKIATRCVKTGKDIDFLQRVIAECKTLNKKDLIKATLGGMKDLYEFVEKSEYSNLADKLEISLTAFEKAVDDTIIEYVKRAKYQSFGPNPLIAYYLAKEAEIKTVRIILSCKYNGLSDDKIRERMRNLYV